MSVIEEEFEEELVDLKIQSIIKEHYVSKEKVKAAIEKHTKKTWVGRSITTQGYEVKTNFVDREDLLEELGL